MFYKILFLENTNLKYIIDNNQDGEVDIQEIGKKKVQPEKVFNYPAELTIRSNWDLELDWNLE